MANSSVTSTKRQDNPPIKAMRELVEYLSYDEERHFIDCTNDGQSDDPGHIVHSVRAVQKWLERRVPGR